MLFPRFSYGEIKLLGLCRVLDSFSIAIFALALFSSFALVLLFASLFATDDVLLTFVNVGGRTM